MASSMEVYRSLVGEIAMINHFEDMLKQAASGDEEDEDEG